MDGPEPDSAGPRTSRPCSTLLRYEGLMERLVFTHACLLDGEHAATPDSTVVVTGDRISYVGTGETTTGPNDRVIDCRGRTLMPGMTQGHFHSTYREVGLPLMPPLGLENPPAYQAYVAAAN